MVSYVSDILKRTAIGAHTHPLAEITDAGALAAKSSIATADIADDAVTSAKLNDTGITPGLYHRVTVGADGRATSGDNVSAGGGLSTTTDNSTTAFDIATALDGQHKRLFAAGAITLTLKKTGAIGTRCAFSKHGGDITVNIETDASYFLTAGDTVSRTTSFKITGHGYFECVANSDGNHAIWDFYGDSDHADKADNETDFNGQLVFGNLGSVVTSVTGTLTTAAHLGRLIVTSGNITVPTTAGFHCLVKFGGAHTVTFNSTVSPAATTGQVASIFVQSSTVIIMTPLATPVTFT